MSRPAGANCYRGIVWNDLPPRASARELNPRFMEQFDELERDEVERRRRNGVCAQCGRPYAHAAMGDGFAILSCARGHLARAEKKGKLYARAKLLACDKR